MPTKKQDSKSTIDTDSKSAKPSTRPSIQPTTQPSATQPEASTSAVPPTGQLDLNTATLEQLNALPGIGESKARAILDYRIKKGRFSRIDELTEVKGIGEKMLAKLKEFLYVTTS
jgi:competence protein ComEA